MSADTAGGGAGAVVRQGHLRKLRKMKKKYFVLRAETADCSARLEYYESEKKFRAGAPPRRVLPLKSCYNITRRLDLKQKHVIALFTREEQFCIVAENEQELHSWLTAILKQHRSDDASAELLHPIQHVWQVNVQKKGLGSSKNIQGLYNLCLTDKTITLVKIKSQNNVISDLGIPEKIEYSLKNIRRCGDSECFFYMEVGRQTSTGSGELWMHSEDSNIAQSMHSTIYLAMRNCAKDSENERDHIVLPKGGDNSVGLPPRTQSLTGRPRLSNDAGPLRTRSDSMPSRACSSFEVERPSPRHNDLEGLDMSRDEIDSTADWYRTPRIPEEPDLCDVSRDFISSGGRVGGPVGSVQHSRTSSMGTEDAAADGYLPMAPGHEPLPALMSASSGSVCSGTPSTDPRFSEYQLEPATSHIVEGGTRPPRAWSVGSRAALGTTVAGEGRHRAYSVGARCRPSSSTPRAPASAPLLPRASAEDLMELDFSSNCSPQPKVIVARTPPTAGFAEPRSRANTDEYVDMSPRTAFLPPPPVPIAIPIPTPTAAPVQPASHPPPPDGYVEMNYTRAPSRPIDIASKPSTAPVPHTSPPRLAMSSKTPLGSQTIFPISLESPASPPELDDTDVFDEDAKDEPLVHPLTTVREISEEGGRRSPECGVSSSPQYVRLAANPTANKTLARPLETTRVEACSTATVVVAGACLPPARFNAVPGAGGAGSGALQYAALDLQPRRASQPPPPRTYTQIDFLRSEKLHADAT
ncbi:unnamed protein product [Diatraea saccharalis]|uniref:Insulin receptor substrate 1 n=1 Tax=Diatraea saccharalis TaxID=40085 RepID=A0A9N9R3P0_9NEOP|nr:unnamed protein product [Diatraea saccharalis]